MLLGVTALWKYTSCGAQKARYIRHGCCRRALHHPVPATAPDVSVSLLSLLVSQLINLCGAVHPAISQVVIP